MIFDHGWIVDIMKKRDPLKMLVLIGGLILAVTLAHSAITGG